MPSDDDRQPRPRSDRRARSAAVATIEPAGAKWPPDTWVTHLVLDVRSGRPDGAAQATAVLRAALTRFDARGDATDLPLEARRDKPGGRINAVEKAVVTPARPDEGAIDSLRGALQAQHYTLSIRERRDCTHPDCLTSVLVEWSHGATVPHGWHSSGLCGQHAHQGGYVELVAKGGGP